MEELGNFLTVDQFAIKRVDRNKMFKIILEIKNHWWKRSISFSEGLTLLNTLEVLWESCIDKLTNPQYTKEELLEILEEFQEAFKSSINIHNRNRNIPKNSQVFERIVKLWSQIYSLDTFSILYNLNNGSNEDLENRLIELRNSFGTESVIDPDLALENRLRKLGHNFAIGSDGGIINQNFVLESMEDNLLHQLANLPEVLGR